MKTQRSTTLVMTILGLFVILFSTMLLVTPLSASPSNEGNPQRLRTLSARLTRAAATLGAIRGGFKATQTAIAAKIKAIKPGVQATLTAWSEKFRSTAKAAGSNVQATLTAFTSKVQGTLTALPIKINRTATVTADEATAAISSFAASVLGTTVTVVKAGGATSDVTIELSRIEILLGDVEQLAGIGYRAALTNGYAIMYYGSGSISGDIDIDVQDQSLGAFILVVDATEPLTQEAAFSLVTLTFPALAGLTYTPQLSNTGFAWYSGDSTPVINPQTKQVTVNGQGVVLYVSKPKNGKAIAIAMVGRGTYAAFVR